MAIDWAAIRENALGDFTIAALPPTISLPALPLDVAFSGALLQDFLLPVLTSEIYDKYLEFIKARDAQAIDICDFEQAGFGWDHAVAGACLAHRWKLPDELVCCILFHHQGLEILAHPALGRSPVAAVALAALLPDQLRQCYPRPGRLPLREPKRAAFK